ncbi:MAG: hypothetical protein V4611_01060 [Patescibacteria group bacterium]
MKNLTEYNGPTRIYDPRAFDLGRISSEDQARWEAFVSHGEECYDYNDIFFAWVDPRVTSQHLRERMAMLLTAPMGAFGRYPHGTTTDSVGRLKHQFMNGEGEADPQDLPEDLTALVTAQPNLASELALAMIAWRRALSLRWNDYDRSSYSEILTAIKPTLDVTNPDLAGRLPYMPLIGDISDEFKAKTLSPEQEAERRIMRLTLPKGSGDKLLLTIDDMVNSNDVYTNEVSRLVSTLFAEIDTPNDTENEERDAYIRSRALGYVASYVRAMAEAPKVNSQLFDRLLEEIIKRDGQLNVMNSFGFVSNISVLGTEDPFVNVAMTSTENANRTYLLSRYFTPNAFSDSNESLYTNRIANDTARSAVEWLGQQNADVDTEQARIIVETCRELLTDYDNRVATTRQKKQQRAIAKIAARQTLYSEAA